MLNVSLALVPVMNDDVQIVFSTQPVVGPAHLVVATFIGMLVRVVGETDRIKNQTLVNLSLVNMGGKYKLILATQYFFCQLHPDFMSFPGGRCFRLKGLDLVAAQVCTFVYGMAACSRKFNDDSLVGMSRSAVQRHQTKTLQELRVALSALMPKGG